MTAAVEAPGPVPRATTPSSSPRKASPVTSERKRHTSAALPVLAALNTPPLPEALCVVDPQFFDYELEGERLAAQRKRHKAAAELCLECRTFSACASWVQTASRDELSGIIAGEVYPHRVNEAKRRYDEARKAEVKAARLAAAA